ncbi:carboxypeptidase-like regulatory domain-containing protein [Marixanthomonas sp. SCSIO 43207]|uniref:DUF5686 and carboxypeptidase regulatory-like domain-containing protein n=1 Tax=Marixanthomonas sp. SCSIO 43207 TaxID=2779360 RepID=UPI001CAA3AD7|nr:DUF5686 and carboxypeptidase regulatory-like domain-containing protein [Marixanthomonas sp. SCSIO 43207]UAB81150.1 carboxypeptidase-like regulatory domain-containing protein [Marixanthomonas sp. SCSIO 43207]
MTRILLAIVFLTSAIAQAQLVGKVTDTKNNPLPFVNIYLKDSYKGTTTNDNGNYKLTISETGQYQVIFQFLGYKTVTKTINATSLPHVLNVTLQEESVSLDEVVLNNGEDPAYRIIRQTINNRRLNLEKNSAYTADFYSRGIWRVEDLPEKILGQEVGDFDGALDSTRTGIIYLSETISEIAYQKPDNFKEKIIASKVSGNDNGFSFNSAQDANFSFYENTIDINAAIVSPIADNALNYYKYKLDGVFYEENKLINKIKVTPKRPKDRVWEGFIYIVEDDWQLYGTELTTTGTAIQVPMVTKLIFKQNFKFDTKTDSWVKRSQTIDFGFKFLGFQGDGQFIAVYSNYDFKPQFSENTFSNEVLLFTENANKKDSIFWKGTRPVPLTNEELKDYIKKDSIQELRKSKKYLDSVDAVSNKLRVLDPITGYTYKNTYNKWRLNYEGIIPGINFNTVQGWNAAAGLQYFKWYDENQTEWLSIYGDATYGISEDRLRFTGGITKNFNRTNRLRLSLFGGSKVQQFNANEPISPIVNTVSTLFFERNYMKVYELNHAKIAYSQELFNGLRLFTNAGFEQRKPLFNTTDYVTIPNDDVSYTSNNPINSSDFDNAAITEHELFKTTISAAITFGQKYMTYPDGKYNLGNNKYPALNITFENGLGASNKDYNYSQLKASVYQSINTGNKGEFAYRLKGGTFFNGENISFVDYQHFNGNQTRIGTSSNYTNVFNLLPYYQLSTNKNYFEGHLEHDFKGWILGKIPGVNQLNFNLVAGAHLLSIENNKPYSEFSVGIDNLGIGNFRFLRLDYVRSYYNGNSDGAFVFGLKFLGFLD